MSNGGVEGSELPYFAPPWDLSDALRKSLRGMEHLSVQEVAKQLGVTRNTVGNWLSGRVEPDERTLMAWSRITAVPYRWLLSYKERAEPLRMRFTESEMMTMRDEARQRGITLSALLREMIRPPMTEDELEKFDSDTLMGMWFENHRIYLAQREDPGPREMADLTSLYSPIMSTRIEEVLNRRLVYPALELNRQKEALMREGVPDKAFTIIFEWPGMTPAGAGPVATIQRVGGSLPPELVDPVDQTGSPMVGRWIYDSIDENRALVVYSLAEPKT